MVDVAQLVRVADCGSVGRGFEPHLPPLKRDRFFYRVFYVIMLKSFIFDIVISPLLMES